MPSAYIKRILQANVYDIAIETPLDNAQFLSARFKNRILIKREDLQPTFSFKVRGAYNKLVHLDAEARQKGVITVSAGNHAQGVALAAQHLGIESLIVMPKTTPRIKLLSVEAYGSEIILHGDTFDDALAYAKALTEKKGLIYIPAFDDPDVIAGQATIAIELLKQHPAKIDAVFAPVGGGGLIAGVGTYLNYLSPETKVIGVEPKNAAGLHSSLQAGKVVRLDRVGLFADGVAVSEIGQETFRLAKDCVDEVVLVSPDEICAAVKDIYEDTRSIVEPSGALGVAGLKKYIEREGIENQSLIAIDSGANVSFERLQHIAESAEIGQGTEVLLAVSVPEHPGSFKVFCRALEGYQITEFNYRFLDTSVAHVFVGVKVNEGNEGRTELIQKLTLQGYAVVDLSNNDLAKIHIRHMVGGHGFELSDEVIYRVHFDERPNALLFFLQDMGSQWNISLFHYRNHGAAYGRVLMGLQVSRQEAQQVAVHLKSRGYLFWDETDNPAYHVFLR